MNKRCHDSSSDVTFYYLLGWLETPACRGPWEQLWGLCFGWFTGSLLGGASFDHNELSKPARPATHRQLVQSPTVAATPRLRSTLPSSLDSVSLGSGLRAILLWIHCSPPLAFALRNHQPVASPACPPAIPDVREHSRNHSSLRTHPLWLLPQKHPHRPKLSHLALHVSRLHPCPDSPAPLPVH